MWRAYRRDLLKARREPAARALRQAKVRLKDGSLTVTPLRRLGQTVGFVVHPKRGRTGLQAESLYLTPGSRTARGLREVMESLQREGPVFSVPGTSAGLDRRVVGRVLTSLGFRLARREWLSRKLPVITPDARLPAPFRLRQLHRSDERAVAQLSARAYSHHIDSAFGPGGDARAWAPGYVRDLFINRKRPIDYSCSFVSVQDRGLIGDAIVVNTERGPHLIDLSVDPALRRRGIGTALMHRTLAALSARGFGRVDLSVTTDNPTGAPDLYRGLGFSRLPGPSPWPGIWVNEAIRRRMHLRVRGE